MKVVVKLMGGMGNQMFQYAFGKRISLQTGRELILDLSFLNRRDLGPNFVYRNYDLDIFNLSKHKIVDKFDENYELIVDDFDFKSKDLTPIDTIIEKCLNNKSENIYIDGYWSSPKYFSEIINSEFSFKDPIINESTSLIQDILSSNSVLLNIRRTDFLNIEQNNAAMFDVILINPPFNIPYEDSATLNRYYLGRGKAAQGSDYLVLERAIRLLKPETGRLLVILPHGVASGVSETEVRNFVKSRTHIHGCISLPVGSFKPFGGSNARTCVLYLKKTTGDNKKRFLAQAEHVGYDITSKYYRETDLNDLPVIAEAYHRVKLELQ